MFPDQTFSAPFFIQYGPGNTQTVDGANKYLYAVSNDGYTYNGNYLHLARVPLDQVQDGSAWQYYHGSIGGGAYWTSSVAGATRVLQARHGLSQPVIQYVPALKQYVLMTFNYIQRAAVPEAAPDPVHAFGFYTVAEAVGPVDARLSTTPPSAACGAPPARASSVGAGRHVVGRRDARRLVRALRPRPRAEVRVHPSAVGPGVLHLR